jgi:hypothetical protein
MKFNFNLGNEDINKINEDAEAYRKEYKERGGFQAGVPVCFLGDGTYVFRILPDRDSKGFVRLIRRAWIHSRIPVEGKKLRFWKDDRVDNLLTEAADAGLEKIWGKPVWQYKSREHGYMMAYFYESSDEEFTKAKHYYGAILDRRQMFAIQDFIAGLHLDDKRKMLDPNNAAPGIKISIARGSGKANVSCGIAGMTALDLPDLEFKNEDGEVIPYTGLDSIYINEDDKISDEDFFKLKNAVYEEITNFRASGGKAKDKSSEAHKFSDKAAEAPTTSNASSASVTAVPQQSASVQASSSTAVMTTAANPDEIECRLANQCKINAKMSEVYPNVRFANKPTKANPFCLACDYEELCTIATEKAKKAA